MEKKSRKEFKELSEEQLKEVTGGVHPVGIPMMKTCAASIIDNSCPSMRFDLQCHCID